MKPTPETIWAERDQLVGKGDRIVKDGQAEVPEYRISFYVEVAAAREALRPFVGYTYEELCKDRTFFKYLAEGRFRKTLRIAFLRRVSKARLVSTFHGVLTLRAGMSSATDIERLTAAFEDATEEDVLTIRLDADGERLDVEATWRQPPGLTLRSQGLWLAIQQAYFDEQTEVPLVRAGMIRGMPLVLEADPHSDGNSVGTASLQAPADGTAPPTGSWRSFARRSVGKEGYKFGDLTRGTFAKLRERHKSHGEGTGDAPSFSSQKGDEQVYLLEIAQLRSEVEKLRELSAQAEIQRRGALLISCLLGAAIAMLAVILLHALLPLRLERPVWLAAFVSLAGGAILYYRQQLSAEPSGE